MSAVPSGVRTLVVDDEDSMRLILREGLESGYAWKVDEARDGVEALQKATHNRYDLIITDVVMPNLDGIDFISQLRTSNTNNEAIIMVMSGHMQMEDLQNSVKLPLTCLLGKPFALNSVFDRYVALLQKQRELREAANRVGNEDVGESMDFGDDDD